MRFILISFLLSSMVLSQDWSLVWQDEFNGPKIDTTVWSFEQGFIRNQELQYYTRDRSKNARIENGVLIIEAHKEIFANSVFDPKGSNWKTRRERADYTSASLTTRGNKEWQYGRIEVRAQLPTGTGTWPAIWMLGQNRTEVGWPECGEIDIMENVGFDPDVIHGTVHTQAYNHIKGTQRGGEIKPETPYDRFYEYAIEWTPDKIDFFVGDTCYFTFINEQKTDAEWPFDQPFHLKLNLAIGGGWGGKQGIDETIFPQQFLIDYVRVYQTGGGNENSGN